MTPLAPAAPSRAGSVTPASAGFDRDRRRVAERHAPRDVAFVQIDRDQLAVRRLHERQAAPPRPPPSTVALAGANVVAPLPSPMKSASTSEARGFAADMIRRARCVMIAVRSSSSRRACRSQRIECARRPSWRRRSTPGPLHRALQRGRREDRPDRYFRMTAPAPAPSAPASDRTHRRASRPVGEIAGGLVGKRLRRRGVLAGHVARRHRTLFNRPDRLAGDAIEDERESLLRHLHDGVDAAAVDASS